MTGNNLADYLTLGLIMFSIGAVGVIVRRNPIVIFMCIELMLNAVNLTFLAFARFTPTSAALADRAESFMSGQMMVVFVMAVAAAEVAVGLGIIMAIYRLRNEIDIDEMNLLKG
ncbi:MAG: NADH-quinone oxidoreductase subunit NuoK [Fimbriimonadaceae bacterium]|nr:NADH-quinone oxidoreductase subunit NuoK [Fimbriimonadaceae bacterium]